MNDLGTVVGVDQATNTAAVWTADGLKSLPAETFRAFDVNNAGVVVGELHGFSPFRWDRDGGVLELPISTADGEKGSGFATAVNDMGQVVYNQKIARGSRALLFDGVGARPLAAAFEASLVWDINDLGESVGLVHSPGTRVTVPAFFHEDGSVTTISLDRFPPGTVFAEFSAIDNQGQAAGAFFGSDGDGWFLWKEGLLTLITDPHPIPSGTRCAAQLLRHPVPTVSGLSENGVVGGRMLRIGPDGRCADHATLWTAPDGLFSTGPVGWVTGVGSPFGGSQRAVGLVESGWFLWTFSVFEPTPVDVVLEIEGKVNEIAASSDAPGAVRALLTTTGAISRSLARGDAERARRLFEVLQRRIDGLLHSGRLDAAQALVLTALVEQGLAGL